MYILPYSENPRIAFPFSCGITPRLPKGCILAASHTVPPETPDENIFAMYDAAGVTKAEILDKAAVIRSTLSHVD